jgi:hypothetical protein
MHKKRRGMPRKRNKGKRQKEKPKKKKKKGEKEGGFVNIELILHFWRL